MECVSVVFPGELLRNFACMTIYKIIIRICQSASTRQMQTGAFISDSNNWLICNHFVLLFPKCLIIKLTEKQTQIVSPVTSLFKKKWTFFWVLNKIIFKLEFAFFCSDKIGLTIFFILVNITQCFPTLQSCLDLCSLFTDFKNIQFLK